MKLNELLQVLICDNIVLEVSEHKYEYNSKDKIQKEYLNYIVLSLRLMDDAVNIKISSNSEIDLEKFGYSFEIGM